MLALTRRYADHVYLGSKLDKFSLKLPLLGHLKYFRLYMEIFCSPIMPRPLAGNKYIFVLINDHSMYMWIILLKEKSEAFEKFKKFKCLIDQETVAKIQISRTDRGGEFVSREFNTFCDNLGIIRYLTAPYTPQQNGVLER